MQFHNGQEVIVGKVGQEETGRVIEQRTYRNRVTSVLVWLDSQRGKGCYGGTICPVEFVRPATD